VIYGLLNLPWIVFAFKPCVLFLSKSRETAYDKEGNCVPKYIGSKMYKFRIGKKRIIINSKGISFKVDQIPNKEDLAIKEGLKKDYNHLEKRAQDGDPENEGDEGGFSIDVDIQDLLKFENLFKLS
jgi:hypothetical protein